MDKVGVMAAYCERVCSSLYMKAEYMGCKYKVYFVVKQ